jgi:hypothetical protein
LSVQPKCADCGAVSPEGGTRHPLISTAFGWRSLKVTRLDGSEALAWRCPTCWSKRKQRLSTRPRPVETDAANIPPIPPLRRVDPSK